METTITFNDQYSIVMNVIYNKDLHNKIQSTNSNSNSNTIAL